MKKVVVILLIGVLGALAVSAASAQADSLIFKTICKLETTGPYPSPQPMDPIVHPGAYPAGHMHEFFGNTYIKPNSTGFQLKSDGAATHTSCADRFDTAEYWVPVMYRDGVRVQPRLVDVYYRRHPGLTTSDGTPINTVTRPPTDFRMIAGNHDATSPQSIISWHCRGQANTAYDEPPACPPGAGEGIGADIVFPSCWDGSTNHTGPDNTNNVVYMRQSNGTSSCPAGYNVQVPRLGVETLYDNPTLPDCHQVATPVDGQNCYVYTFSEVNPVTGQVDNQGSVYSLHADFLNGWNPSLDTVDNPPLDFKSLIDEFLNAPDGSGSSSACVETCTTTNPPGDAN